jgi:dTDP-4-dehydrorhamnose 3,5-epimerase
MSDVTYQVSHPYTPGAEGGLRWDDPAIGIAWPLPVSVISEKDAAWPPIQL